VIVGAGVDVGAGVLVASPVEAGVGSAVGVGATVGASVGGIAGVAVAIGVGAGRPTRLCATQPTPQASAPKTSSATMNKKTCPILTLDIATHLPSGLPVTQQFPYTGLLCCIVQSISVSGFPHLWHTIRFPCVDAPL